MSEELEKNTRGSAEFEATQPMKVRNIRCELVSGEDVSFLEGKLKTFIDSVIPETQRSQNKATKDIIRIILWDWFNYISTHLSDHLLEKQEWYKNNRTETKNK